MTEISRWNGDAWEWCAEVEDNAHGRFAEEVNGKVVGDVTEEEANALNRAVARKDEEVTVDGERFLITQEGA